MNKLEQITQHWDLNDNKVFKIPNKVKFEKKQELTNSSFSEKWQVYSQESQDEQKKFFDFQKNWFLKLYGFEDQDHLKNHLLNCSVILDAGCGLGYKSAWFAELAPHALILAIDYSDSIFTAYQSYKTLFPNIIFAQGDISLTHLPHEIIDFSVCDQVIMHTENPSKTLQELSRITSKTGEILCYWYKKKALPRELLDDYFRNHTSDLSKEELWALSEDLVKLGKTLSDLNIRTNFPDIPGLGIKGGEMDLQRFIYWNFIKCFWNPELGYATSTSTNFDWYSPVNAKRFSKQDIERDLALAQLKTNYFYEEEACYSGRFEKL